jgi:hypothetical protein
MIEYCTRLNLNCIHTYTMINDPPCCAASSYTALHGVCPLTTRSSSLLSDHCVTYCTWCSRYARALRLINKKTDGYIGSFQQCDIRQCQCRRCHGVISGWGSRPRHSCLSPKPRLVLRLSQIETSHRRYPVALRIVMVDSEIRKHSDANQLEPIGVVSLAS